MFLTAPECLVGCLICEVMTDDEAIHIQGPEIFSKYSGYSNRFKFKENYVDDRERLKSDYKLYDREIIAIDAIKFSKSQINELD
mmetsp:Transcript_12698/g.10853  ORF Transcript_12698/g.10853 Transcript_12698/m.10853 type:complete len:84 (-) Transcript_12698:16-267(-)